MTKARMHLDGCHFYVWLAEDGRLTYDERQGQDLALHRSDDPCDRCTALSRGAAPTHHERHLANLPDEPKALVLRVFEAVGEIQEDE